MLSPRNTRGRTEEELMSSNRKRALSIALVLAGLMVAGCQNPDNPTAALAVGLSLAKHEFRPVDTLTGTITLRNKTPSFITVPFANVQQTELLFYDAADSLVLVDPGGMQPRLSTLELWPFCSKAYPFRLQSTLRPGVYRVRARPAGYEAPYAEDAIGVTE